MNSVNLFTLPPQKVVMVLFVIVLAAALFDAMYRRIPNWITVTGAVLGLAINALIGPPEAGILFSVVGLLVAFGSNLVLYALHARGGGDLKLMAAIGALVGWQRWFAIFVISALVGGAFALILVIAKRRVKKTLFHVSFILSEMLKLRPAYVKNEELDVKSARAERIPAGVVIAVSTVFYLAIAANLVK